MTASRRSFGKYRLIADIGHGGMADVYLAVASGLAGVNKLLVIKQIRVELADDPAFVTMFLDEARLASRVNHPNVVQTLEVGEEGGSYYLAMEYLDGQPLSRIQNSASARLLTVPFRVRVLIDVLAGLHHAHELRDYDGTPLGVVHRDATPHNVFVTYDGQVKVVDFGVAKAATSSGQTKTGELKGKLSYMAPEQARGDRIDRRADLFSVGVMLWEALAGRRMWAGLGSDIVILHRLVTGEIPALPPEAGVPPELARVCDRALAIDPANRYATAAEMADDLERYLEKQHPRPSNRELGLLVSSMFPAEQAKIQATISEQLSLLTLATSGSHPAIPILPRADEPALPTRVEVPVDPSGCSPSSFTAHPSAASLPPPGQPPKRSQKFVIAAVGLGVALGALAMGQRLATPAPAPASSQAPAREVEIRVAAQPPTARLFLDDEPLPANPHTMKLAADSRTHLLRAEAEGHLPRVRPLSFDKDFAIEISLERVPGAAASSAAPPAARPTGGLKAGPLPTGDAPKKPAKGRRDVDSSNPYAQ